MILITGSAGKTGRAVIRALIKKGEQLRALARNPEQAAQLKELGAADAPLGDLLDQASIARAMQGVQAVYHIPPNVNPDEAIIGRIVINAARAANVERFVLHSVLQPQISAMPHHWQKLRVEEMVLKSGLSFTILQPAVYMQNILVHWDQIVNEGIYPVPYSADTQLSMVDLEDAAEVTAKILTEHGHAGASYEVVGTSALSQTEIAETLSAQLHRPVTVQIEFLEEWERTARASGMGEYQRTTLMRMFRYYEEHGLTGNPTVLGYLLGRQPASLTDFIDRIFSEQKDGLTLRAG